MGKKMLLLALVMFGQMAFLFAADQNFQRGVNAHMSLMRDTLPAKGIAPDQVEALVGVMDNMAFDVAGHVRLVAWMLIIFNFLAVLLALPKRE